MILKEDLLAVKPKDARVLWMINGKE